MSKEIFGNVNGRYYWIYTIASEHITARITDLGATLVSLKAFGMDTVISFPEPQDYIDDTGAFIGAVIVPNANRTKGASYQFDGRQWQLEVNENGNNLHSAIAKGCHRRKWRVAKQSDTSITLQLRLTDGELGFPGNRTIEVVYTVRSRHLTIEYSIVSDKPTVFNPTNHSYFSFNGSESILDYQLQTSATRYLPVDREMIPTGEKRVARGTPFDFQKKKTLGQDIGADDEQLHIARGYDHTFLVRGYDGQLRKFVTLENDELLLTGYTDLPGFQLYTANFLDYKGHKPQSAVCLETHFPPNCLNEPNFLKPYVPADTLVAYQTIFDFKRK